MFGRISMVFILAALWSTVALASGEPCDMDSMCSNGETCMSGICVGETDPAPDEPCTSDEDCSEGYTCIMAGCYDEEGECPMYGYCEYLGYSGECTSDDDCDVGFGCVRMSCACAEGEECDCPEDGMGYCEYMGEDDEPWYTNECEQDSDCPAFFTCGEIALPCEAVPMPACDCPDGDDECWEKCDAYYEEYENCTNEVIKVCSYDQVQCQADADCGDGFACQFEEECSGGGACTCSGCACPACPDGEECPPCDCPEEPVCECDDTEPVCTTSEVGYCFPKMEECAADSDCVDGFVCESIDMGSDCDCACTCEAMPCDSEDGDCGEPVCDCGECDCPEGEVEQICLPDGWREAAEQGGFSGVEGYDDLASNGENSEEEPTINDDVPKDGTTDEDGDVPNGETDKTGGAGADNTENSSGCTVADTGSSSAMLLILALFAALLIPRRRTNS